jgi:uncharacterized protein (DUF924 family)
MSRIEDILRFWLVETDEKHWYAPPEDLDDRIRASFAADWGRAVAGLCEDWLVSREGALAFLILTDQFPRNMFRGRALAFASDDIARAAAGQALTAGHDLATEEPARQFFYMPFMHSEDLDDQDLCFDLFSRRMVDGDNLLHAAAHRQVIRRYGRFPTRNAALGRATTPAEKHYLEEGGYGALVRSMKESHAARA